MNPKNELKHVLLCEIYEISHFRHSAVARVCSDTVNKVLIEKLLLVFLTAVGHPNILNSSVILIIPGLSFMLTLF